MATTSIGFETDDVAAPLSLLFGTPNVNPPADGAVVVELAPNTKPVALGVLVSAVDVDDAAVAPPNTNPEFGLVVSIFPLLAGTPKLNPDDALPLDVLKAKNGTLLGSVLGRACSHAEHLVRLNSLRTIHVLHSQLALCFATMLLKPASSVAAGVDLAELAPGFGVSQATHLSLSESFRMQHTLHSHLDDC